MNSFKRAFTCGNESFFLFGPRGTGKTTWLKENLPGAYVVDLLNNDIRLRLTANPERLRDMVAANNDCSQIVIDEIELPIVVDAGIGRPSQACEAMEMGAAAIMANTALATAGDLPMMASAFKQAIEAGRKAYLAGLGRVMEKGGSASSPLTGFLRE